MSYEPKLKLKLKIKSSSELKSETKPKFKLKIDKKIVRPNVLLKGNFFYIGRCPNDQYIDTKTGKKYSYTKSGITDNPRQRRPQYETNQHEPFKFYYLYQILNKPADYVEDLFHDKETAHLTGEVVLNQHSVGTEIRFSSPGELNNIFIKMCRKYNIKYRSLTEQEIEEYNLDSKRKQKKSDQISKSFLLRDIKKKNDIVLRDYQQETINLIKSNQTYLGEKIEDRGQVILPTGTGKTEVMIRLVRDMISDGKKILICVPNLNLVQQFYLSIRGKLDNNIPLLVIASDLDPALDDRKNLIANPDLDSIEASYYLNDSMIVLSTYQSASKLFEVNERMIKTKNDSMLIDVAFFDECHRTVGLENTNKAKLLFNENLQIDSRYFFTATRRFFKGEGKNVSMENEEQYGPVINLLSYREAISYEHLTDYTIINTYSSVESGEINQQIASIRYSFSQYPLKKMLVYCNKCKDAKFLKEKLEENFQYNLDPRCVDLSDIKVFYIDAKTRASDREEIFKYFRDSEYDDQPALICSVNTICEGVDLVKADSICFAQPRKSELNIIQTLGRILRKDITTKSKMMSYVIIPSTEGDFSSIRALYQALARNDELKFECQDTRTGKSIPLDDIIGKICNSLNTRRIDDSGKARDNNVDYSYEEIIKIIESIRTNMEASGILGKWEYIFERMKEIADKETLIFKRSQINEFIPEFNEKYGGYNGKTPQNTMSRDLQKIFRDKFGALKFEPRGKRGEYQIIKDSLND